MTLNLNRQDLAIIMKALRTYQSNEIELETTMVNEANVAFDADNYNMYEFYRRRASEHDANYMRAERLYDEFNEFDNAMEEMEGRGND